MSLCDVVAVLELSGEGRPTETPALRQAITLARAAEASLSILIAAAKAPRPFTPFAPSFVSALAAEINDKAKLRCDEVEAAARRLAAEAGLTADIDVRIEDLDAMRSDAARRGRCHDLAVVDQPDAPLDGRGVVFESLLLESGRPVLVATPARAPLARIESAAIGWDGSAYAARTVGDLLGLFPTLKRAHIVTIVGDKDLTGAASAEELAAHLARHRVESSVDTIERTVDRTVAATLDARTQETGCDILVIGGFARPRWREIVLGGATNHLVRKAGVPLLLAH
jgi:nucleotide-binding universal stress UspA family protein